MSAYLKLDQLVCGYEKFNLKTISFELQRGIFAGIIGPNGSGKTTLFRALTGDLKIKEGELTLKGKQLSQMPIREKARQVAVVSQFTEQTDISVYDYVMMGRLPYRSNFQFFETKNDIAIAEKYMQLTHIDGLKDKSMMELSGGEQQLAAIARALTQEPDLLLLDEPTSHLDITHQVQILNLIQRLNKELGLTVLIIIHDLNLAGEYCDYLLMMKDGQLRAKGRPAEVLNYQIIEDVYDTVVITRENPVSKKPVVFLVSDRVMKNVDRQDPR